MTYKTLTSLIQFFFFLHYRSDRRNRLAFEKCYSIYNNEMDRKIRFLVRKNRENPYPWD